jgi:glycolate oxidase iron-sulfur subunit
VDLLRLGQGGLASALLARPSFRSRLPRFASQGLEMTPPLRPRGQRALERVARRLPSGATMARRAHGLVFDPPGAARRHVGLFTSCVMESMFPEINHEMVRLLVLAGCRVTVPAGQTCCGALHAHSGLREEACALARVNVAAFDGGFDAIVTDSAGCGAALREFGHLLSPGPGAERASAFAGRVRDISEVLLESGLPEPRRVASAADPARPLRVGYHDPCHLAHAQGVRRPPRALLERVPGIELTDLPDSDWCCGSAGVYNLTHPDMAEIQLAHKLDAIAAVSPELVVASNPGCAMHMARGVRARGLPARVVHLLEVLALAYPAEGAQP